MDARNPYRYAPNGLTVVKVDKVKAREIVFFASFDMNRIDENGYA